jgi:hypothetical protein
MAKGRNFRPFFHDHAAIFGDMPAKLIGRSWQQ